MLELAVSSDGRHSMDMMPLSIRNPQERRVIVGQNGAACVVDQGRKTRK